MSYHIQTVVQSPVEYPEKSILNGLCLFELENFNMWSQCTAADDMWTVHNAISMWWSSYVILLYVNPMDYPPAGLYVWEIKVDQANPLTFIYSLIRGDMVARQYYESRANSLW